MPLIKQYQPFTGILNNSSLWIWSIKMSVMGSAFSSVGRCTYSPLLKLDITMDIFQHIFLRFRGNHLEKFHKIKSKFRKGSCILKYLKTNSSTDDFKDVSLKELIRIVIYYTTPAKSPVKIFLFLFHIAATIFQTLCVMTQ